MPSSEMLQAEIGDWDNYKKKYFVTELEVDWYHSEAR